MMQDLEPFFVREDWPVGRRGGGMEEELLDWLRADGMWWPLTEMQDIFGQVEGEVLGVLEGLRERGLVVRDNRVGVESWWRALSEGEREAGKNSGRAG